jgi:phenylpropionate dioxygenase-like ring-hydroxylating dioxygenase large terminal subunit
VVLNDWYPIENEFAVNESPLPLRLLGTDLLATRDTVMTADGRDLPVRHKYGFLWTSLGTPAGEIFDIPESLESDRRYVACGWITLQASAPRLVENFLDMAHFPFVHADILGTEAHAEVARYESEIRAEVDEVWATNCRFFQPQVTAGTAGALADITYRVPSPFLVMLYRVPPQAPSRLDVIALFITPIEPDLCRAQPVEWLVDAGSSDAQLLDFEQTIFLQDRVIVENQRPRLLDLNPKRERPTYADNSSTTYRRWLKQKGLTYGVINS